MATKKQQPQLTYEHYITNENHFLFTMIECRRKQYLCVIDTMSSESISAYVLDLLEPNGIDPESFLLAVTYWFYHSSHEEPLSVFIAKNNLIDTFSKIHRVFETNTVSRIIGQLFAHNVSEKTKVKRRRIIPVQECIEVKFK